MKHPIDLEHWNRKEHFLFFGSMDDPFFGLTTQIDVTSIYKEAKADHASFFLYSLHKIMTAVNEVEEFRYRIIDNIPVCFDRIHVGTTIGGKTVHSASASSNIHRTGNCSFKTHRKRSNVCKLSQAFAKIGNQTGKT